jgi:hypothetical protein
MGAVALLHDILTVLALGHLLQMEAEDIQMTLLRLHSVVVVPDHDEIWLIHPSFHHFMTQRCPAGSQYLINPVDCHRQLVLTCFKTMNDYLRKDICGIQDMWKLNAEVEDLDDCVAVCIPAHLQYACRHWATHLSKALSCANSAKDNICDALMVFSSLHLLHWLEVLSPTGWLEEALPALRHTGLPQGWNPWLLSMHGHSN